MKHTGFKIAVIVLLAFILAALGGNLYIAYQRWTIELDSHAIALRADDARRAAEIQRIQLLDSLAALDKDVNPVIDSILDDYNQAAYHDTGVDRITEQQLLASEYQLQIEYLLLKQNQLLLHVLAGK